MESIFSPPPSSLYPVYGPTLDAKRVIVVGGGIAGLAAGLGLGLTGHQVTILERSNDFTEAGAGIQLAPNAMRILERFGVLKQVLKEANTLSRVSLRRYADNKELASFPLMPHAKSRYGAHACVIHRADLQRILVTAAQAAGCRIMTSQRVVQVDAFFAARVKTADGTWYQGDLVLACDGLWSGIRRQMEAALGSKYETVPTGDAAYRMLIPSQRLGAKPQLQQLMGQDTGVRWLGPQGHLMAYPVRKGAMYNLVLLHPVSTGASPHRGVKARALSFCRGWSPLVQQLLSTLADDDITEWRLYNNKPPLRWVLNRVALAGDASHCMLPYLAQGSAVALEDVGALVAALTCTADLDLALAAYEEARHERSARIQADAHHLQQCLHMQDGDEQALRDEAIQRAARDRDAGCECPDLWLDRAWQDFAWGFDAMEHMVDGWHDLVAKLGRGSSE
ncbi:hypothetical protein CDD81_3935 [Ophiocordyceps australis]|uniref:FAD-binding domain-containing protein n=1 Tax=Ophiocordyceps australis TaxID=1399860 RepID=A0A2C5XVQ4_9HYPO|nr:hypothetical protein CDD81_3935 [Ophiocordyceps australis]